MSTNQGLEAQEGEEERVRDIGRGREMCGCPFMLVLLCPFCLLQMKEGGYWRGAGREERGERERGECDALSCPLARLLLIKNHNAPPSLCAVGRMHHVQNVCESHRGSIRGACHVRCIMHSEHTRNNNAFTPSSGHYQDGILPWLGFFRQTTGRQGKCELQVFSAV